MRTAELIRFFLRRTKEFSLKINFMLWAESYLRLLVGWIPGFEGVLIRNFAYKLIFKKINGFCRIREGVYFTHACNIELGNNSAMSFRCYVQGRGGVKIGDNTQFGANVVVISSNHDFGDRTTLICEQGHTDGPVTIGNDVWVGANAVILPNVTVADGTVVGAGAVVTKSTEPYSIVAGVPAVKIGSRR